ncbi:MAG: DASH family cryptochrome [Bdellovibrionales bacterium]|nr:DASH family cryptochrome [Bdellovibrionales bacterium]
MKLIYWLRNDLRQRDNEALNWIRNNVTAKSELAFLYISPTGSKRLGAEKKRFIDESLAELAFALKERFPVYKVESHNGSTAVLQVLNSVKPDAVIFTKEHTYDEIAEEEDLNVWAKLNEVSLKAIDQSTILPSSDLPFAIDQLPKVFTAFRQKVEPLILAKDFSIDEIRSLPSCENLDLGELCKTSGLPIETVAAKSFHLEKAIEDLPTRGFRFYGGFKNGQTRITEYLWDTDSVQSYFESRNGMIEKNDSTKFSPWLAVGAISPREIIHELRRYETDRIKNKSTYWVLFELLWRDFFKYEALRVGKTLFQLNGPNGKRPQTVDEDLAKTRFEKWSRGETESDFINANMRELVETGWMSNRGRQNVASYLAKTLEVPWTLGADFFERHLVDYDAAVNWGNWNYFSGVGRDPRDRRFNTTTQENSYDPDGHYRKKWRAT